MTLKNIFFCIPAVVIFIAASCSNDEPKDEQTVASCKKCHDNTTTIYAAGLQYENSVHWTGGNFDRNTKDCAPCHVNEGFNEIIANDSISVQAIDNPTPVGCYTCHFIHENYDNTDLALKTTDPVTSLIDGSVIDMGKGNLCAHCHQPISIATSTSPALNDASTDSVTISSSRFGPHHGPQAAMLAGNSAFTYGEENIHHAHYTLNKEAGCLTCHMAKAVGRDAGGHTMRIESNYAGCYVSGCHNGLDEEGLNAKVEEFAVGYDTLMVNLNQLLQANNLLTVTGSVNTNVKFSADQARAVYNYKFLEEDRSLGIHNPQYAMTLLKNTLAKLRE